MKKNKNFLGLGPKMLLFILTGLIIFNIVLLIFSLQGHNSRYSKVEKIKMYAKIDFNRLGIDADKGKIDFGIVPPEAVSKTNIVVENSIDSEVIVNISIKGNISDKVVVSPKNFVLLPDSEKTVSFIFYAGKERPSSFNGTAYVMINEKQ